MAVLGKTSCEARRVGAGKGLDTTKAEGSSSRHVFSLSCPSPLPAVIRIHGRWFASVKRYQTGREPVFV